MCCYVVLLILSILATVCAFTTQTSHHANVIHTRQQLPILLQSISNNDHDTPTFPSRRLALMITAASFLPNTASNAAPPIAIIAEELGYFPLTNLDKDGNITVSYAPKRVQRESTDQAVALAKYLSSSAIVYTAYWCPHCARQAELFGKQAWGLISRVECASKGYNAQPLVCATKNIDGFPTWIINKKKLSGEQTLEALAEAVGYKGFDASLETNVPPLVGQSCSIKK